MSALNLILATVGPDAGNAAEATRTWAALLLAMLLAAIVLVGSLWLLMVARRHWRPDDKRAKKPVEIADAWVEAGKRIAVPPADGAGDDLDDDPDEDDAFDGRD